VTEEWATGSFRCRGRKREGKLELELNESLTQGSKSLKAVVEYGDPCLTIECII